MSIYCDDREMVHEFLCAHCGLDYPLPMLAFACASPDGLLGICEVCAA